LLIIHKYSQTGSPFFGGTPFSTTGKQDIQYQAWTHDIYIYIYHSRQNIRSTLKCLLR